MGWDGGLRGRSEREGMYVYIWLIHFAVQQKLTQYSKAIICQLKKKKDPTCYTVWPKSKKKKRKEREVCLDPVDNKMGTSDSWSPGWEKLVHFATLGSILGFLAPVSLWHLGKLYPGLVHLSEHMRSGCLFLNHLNNLYVFDLKASPETGTKCF